MAKFSLNNLTKNPIALIAIFGGLGLAAVTVFKSKAPEPVAEPMPVAPPESYSTTGGPGMPLALNEDLSTQIGAQLDPVFSALGGVYTQLETTQGTQDALAARQEALQGTQETLSESQQALGEGVAGLSATDAALAQRIEKNVAIDKKQGKRLKTIEQKVGSKPKAKPPGVAAAVKAAPVGKKAAAAAKRAKELGYTKKQQKAVRAAVRKAPVGKKASAATKALKKKKK